MELKIGKNQENFEEIRLNLLQHKGGKVIFEKNLTTGVAAICIDHPEKRNALSGSIMVQLRDCIEDLEKWEEGKAVILCGKGSNFCSGADLDFARKIHTEEGAVQISTWMQDILKRLQNLPLFSVCLIHGPTLGGGAELSVFCDYIIAADTVKYGFVHGKMGIITSFGGCTRLVRKIGQHKALDLLLTSKILSAQECVDIGLAEHIVHASNALEEIDEWLKTRIQHHHTVTRGIKKVVCNVANQPLQEALEYEKSIFIPFWGSKTNKEALAKRIKHVKS